jgi:type 1 glutamine amidotransferase
MMEKVYFLYIILFLFFTTMCEQGAEKHVLIYTKNGEGYVHDNIPASVEALKKICDASGISYVVSEDPAIFDPGFKDRFDGVIFSNTNNEVFENDQQRQIFKEFIQSGGGYVGIHIACGSERNWPWYWAMAGGKFVRHPQYQPFDIKVIDGGHPSTNFLPHTWRWEDECYFMNQLNPDINVLLAADLGTVNDPEMEKYPGDIFGDLFPLAWYHEYDGGREFFTALGHDIEHYKDDNYIKHLTGGILWSLRLKE